MSSQELRLLQIARLNSEAITHFQHGDRVTAKDTFVFSLGQLKSICEGDTSQDDTTAQPADFTLTQASRNQQSQTTSMPLIAC